MDVIVDQSGTTYLLHVVGRADLGVDTKDDAGERDVVGRLAGERDPDAVARLLRLELATQSAGATAPLCSAMSMMAGSADLGLPRLVLVLIATSRVEHIAAGIESGLRRAPAAYGRECDEVRIALSPSLEETDAADAVRAVVADASPATDRALVVWGSGSTQLALGCLDAVIDAGLPWSLAWVHPHLSGRRRLYEPTNGLSIDPVVPLLRRWRYHDLVLDLVRRGDVAVSDVQRSALAEQAERWGRAYTEPTAARLRAVMAAALMRGDGSSGFATRAYVLKRYEELREQDSSQENLLAWAKRVWPAGRHLLLGNIISLVRKERSDQSVILARASAAGQWLQSPTVSQLNEMGTGSSHELAPPSPAMLDKLRRHLAECEDLPEQTSSVTEDDAQPDGMSPLTLVPGQTAWYVSVLPLPQPNRKHAIEQIAEAAADRDRADQLDPAVRAYLGTPTGQPLPVGLLILGTPETYGEAVALADRLPTRDQQAVADMIDGPDGDGDGVVGTGFSEEAAEALLRRRLGADAGALVLVPSAQKAHVLPLLTAGQRIAAERGIPLFLRQMVTANRHVVEAGTHRLPLRFGADLAILGAASHALDVAELDTAARLLGAITAGRGLDARALTLSYALRCDIDRVDHWPAQLRGHRTGDDLRRGFLADRIEMWANLPALTSDVETQMRAIVGACATAESSYKDEDRNKEKAAKRRLRSEVLRPLYTVRDNLPITHGYGLQGEHALDSLVHHHTGGTYGSPSQLLAAMVEPARNASALPRQGRGIRLVHLWQELRTDVGRLRDEERTRLARDETDTLGAGVEVVNGAL